MTQKEKDLLLKDLCARLPYGVKIKTSYNKIDEPIELIFINPRNESFAIGSNFTITSGLSFDIYECKPYLFPLESMTEEQKKELFKFCEFYIQENGEGKNEEVYGIQIASRPDPAYCYDHTFRIWDIDMRAIDWFLKNHFDIYGLIPMGLALDATGLNIY